MMKVCGHRVLIRPDKVEEVSKGGIIMHASSLSKKMEKAGNVYGTIVAIGPTAWKKFERVIVRQSDGSDKVVHGEPWAKVGDRVIYSKYGGTYVKDDKEEAEELVLLNDEDIAIVLEVETDE